MAEAFKNAYLDVTNSAQTIYTNSSGGASVVYTLRITNVDGSASDTITADVIDGSSGNSRIAFNMTVAAGTSIELAGQSKINLENGDKIDLTGGASSGDLEAFLSCVEIT
tara:strand:- start:362 stop:691 length:330 start_codon:yes stop_codon:yes gene_type:complete